MDDRDKLICKMYEEGYKIDDIKAKVGVSHGTVYNVIKRYDLTLSTEMRERLRKEQYKRVIHLFDNGVQLETICKDVGLDFKTVVLVLSKVRPKELEKELERIKKDKVKRYAKGRKKYVPADDRTREVLDKLKDDSIRFTIMKSTIDEMEYNNALIMKDYTEGLSLKEILDKHDITIEYLDFLLGGEREEPKHIPNKEPIGG